MRAQTLVYGIGASLVAGIGCLGTAEPTGFVFQYRIGVYACDPLGCETPDTIPVTAAPPNDTVWVRHDMVLIQAHVSTVTATIRPICAENVVVRSASATVQSLPTPAACPDSMASEAFILGDTLTRFTQWVLDPALTSATTYAVVGRIMVSPRLEPTFAFQVQ
ncbi:MAG: hypothetical protein ACREMN_04520 [Gemmatimonadales bacterium]